MLSERPGTKVVWRAWPQSSVACLGAVREPSKMEAEPVVDAEQQRKDQSLAAFRAKLLQHKARGCAPAAACACHGALNPMALSTRDACHSLPLTLCCATHPYVGAGRPGAGPA